MCIRGCPNRLGSGSVCIVPGQIGVPAMVAATELSSDRGSLMYRL